MNKKKTTTQAPKRDIASIIDAVKPELKAPIKQPIKIPEKKSIPAKNVKPLPMKPEVKTLVKIPIKPAINPAPVKIVDKTVAEKKVLPVKPAPIVRKSRKENNTIDIPIEHEAYFVYLKNPLEYRKYLLECSKGVLFCLRSHQKLLLIRQKKLEGMERLRTCVKELLYTNKKFNEKLPKYNMTFLENQPAKIQIKEGTTLSKTVQKKPTAPILKEPAREKTELEKLEESLANIEHKLRNLQ